VWLAWFDRLGTLHDVESAAVAELCTHPHYANWHRAVYRDLVTVPSRIAVVWVPVAERIEARS
jgi:hypothetical protein